MPTNKPRKFRRLSADIRPERYAITLEPEVQEGIFKGEEVIDLVFAKPAGRDVIRVRIVPVGGEDKARTDDA